MLLLNGVEPASQDFIRQRYAPSEISFLNCTAISVRRADRRDDKLELSDAASIVSESNGRLRLQLSNQFNRAAAPITQSYDLKFEIYGSSALEEADFKFVEILGQPDPSVADVDRFLMTGAAKCVSGYADALANYVIGVLQKDRPAGQMTAGINYRAKLNGALRGLQEFDRPLANLLSALIRLSSNDVAQRHRASGSELLDVSLGIFWQIANSETPDFVLNPHEPKIGEVICPIDNGTSLILERTASLSRIRRFGDDLVTRFRSEMEIPAIDGLDRSKLAALWASRAISLGMREQAQVPLLELVGDAMFGAWAQNTLEM